MGERRSVITCYFLFCNKKRQRVHIPKHFFVSIYHFFGIFCTKNWLVTVLHLCYNKHAEIVCIYEKYIFS